MEAVLKTPVLALIVGVFVGVLAMLFAGNFGSGNRGMQHEARDLVTVATMTQEAAEEHREESFKTVTTIEEVMRLPTEFMRSEAIHALAGRSDSAALQVLVFEADRIADEVERVQLLNILFFRLAEIDPQSALALARTDQFGTVTSLGRLVWRVWARKDLDEALFAAKAQTSIVDQRFAAQSLYSAFGYMGNATTERIEAELGIGPDRSTRGRYLYKLADKSPAEAIAFINGVKDSSKKRQYISWLAYYLSLSDPEEALRYASLFASDSHTQYFEQIIKRNLASENPRATIERLMASGSNLQQSGEFRSAIRALAESDTEAAMLYFEQIRSVDARRNLGMAIAAELARRDPDAALAWAQANELGQFPFLQIGVLQAVASDDPRRAMEEALALPNSEWKAQLISQVIQRIANNSPTEAIAYLDEIDNVQQKLEASRQMLHVWVRRDARAAMDWVFSQDEEMRTDLLQAAQHVLVDSNIETAMRILPRLDENAGNQLKRQIAERLAVTASPAEALSFIRQFEGEPGYDQLQSALVSGIAHTDVYAARQLADQLPAGATRDHAYTNIVSQHVRTNLAEATRWLNNIDDPTIRGDAAGQIASVLHETDPAAANRWVSSMPAGAMRDNAIVSLASQWRNPDRQQQAMIESISNPVMRGQAKIRRIYALMQSNPDRVQDLLQDKDISEQDRKRIEILMKRGGRIY